MSCVLAHRVSDGEDGLSRYAVKGFVTPAEYKKVYQETQAEQKKQANFRGFRCVCGLAVERFG